MFAIPVATWRRSVAARSQPACTKAFRPRISGNQKAPYPRASTRRESSAVSRAGIASVRIQPPVCPIALEPPGPPGSKVFVFGIVAPSELRSIMMLSVEGKSHKGRSVGKSQRAELTELVVHLHGG